MRSSGPLLDLSEHIPLGTTLSYVSTIFANSPIPVVACSVSVSRGKVVVQMVQQCKKGSTQKIPSRFPFLDVLDCTAVVQRCTCRPCAGQPPHDFCAWPSKGLTCKFITHPPRGTSPVDNPPLISYEVTIWQAGKGRLPHRHGQTGEPRLACPHRTMTSSHTSLSKRLTN